ncbi:expressed unknown protein [Seminavis robusta]|uniref:Peptidase M12B domain-containing protein n=1 Tax=Seminavis robusta TaxID=568900 RepID=A0A9N8DB38_9STRA|nr:expressed unknown protein [Seminavis robusta]|eukprot:Sro20_g014240.1 n/a (461) ;mRNA; f:118432-120272
MLTAVAFILSLALALASWTPVNGQDIVRVEGRRSNLIDVSRLGDGYDLYDTSHLDVQLLPGGPVWMIEKLRGRSDGLIPFHGKTSDEKITADFYKYIAPDGDQILTGHVHDNKNSVAYDISRDESGQYVVKTTRPKDVPHPGSPRITKTTRNSRELEGTSSVDPVPEQDVSAVTIDLMVIWTQNAECELSKLPLGCAVTSTTENTMIARVDALVAETNQIHVNSNTGVTYSLVHRQRDTSGYNFPENDINAALDDLTFNNGTDDGTKLTYVKVLRETHGADLVHLLIEYPDQSQVPGIAFMNNNTEAKDQELGFGVTRWLDLGNYVFAHELGHNMGCNHDRGTNVDQGNPGGCTDPQTNTGYVHPDGDYFTVMAYACRTGLCGYSGTGDCPIIPYFSDGGTYGGPLNNNVAEIRKNKKVIAAFRKTPGSTPAPTAAPSPMPACSSLAAAVGYYLFSDWFW